MTRFIFKSFQNKYNIILLKQSPTFFFLFLFLVSLSLVHSRQSKYDICNKIKGKKKENNKKSSSKEKRICVRNNNNND